MVETITTRPVEMKGANYGGSCRSGKPVRTDRAHSSELTEACNGGRPVEVSGATNGGS